LGPSESHLHALSEGGLIHPAPPAYSRKSDTVRLRGDFRGIRWRIEVSPAARLVELIDDFPQWAKGVFSDVEHAALLFSGHSKTVRPRGRYASPPLRVARHFLQRHLSETAPFIRRQLRDSDEAQWHPRIRAASTALRRELRAFDTWKDADREARIACWIVARRWPEIWEAARFPDPEATTFNHASIRRRHIRSPQAHQEAPLPSSLTRPNR
jgi:hypothetical protein